MSPSSPGQGVFLLTVSASASVSLTGRCDELSEWNGISFSETGSPSRTEHRLLSFLSVKLLRKSSFWGDEDFSSLMAKDTCTSP